MIPALIPTGTARLITKAKTHLVTNHPFIGSTLLGMPLIISDTRPSGKHLPLAFTNGKIIGINPEFLYLMSYKNLIFVLAHECLHCMLGHIDGARIRGRDLKRWGIACDILVNQLLYDDRIGEQFEWCLRDKALYDQGGGCVEGIYRILPTTKGKGGSGGAGEGEPEEKQVQEQSKPEGEQDDTETIEETRVKAGEESGEAGESNSIEGEVDTESDYQDAGEGVDGENEGLDEEREQREGDDTNGDMGGHDQADPEETSSGDEDPWDTEELDEEGNDDSDTQGSNGDEEGGDAAGTGGDSSGGEDEESDGADDSGGDEGGGSGDEDADKGEDGDNEGEGSGGKKPLDILECAGKTPEEQDDLVNDWKRKAQQAMQTARMMGKLSLGMERLVKDFLKPKVMWGSVLHRFVIKASTDERTLARPSRRFISQGLYLPSRTGTMIPELVFSVDCSCSILDPELDQYSSEIKVVWEEYKPSKLHIIYFDHKVMRHDTFYPGDVVKIRAKGGGGTAFSPVFKMLEQKGIHPAACIFLTDLCCDDFGPKPDYPVLWISTYASTAPFGEVTMMGDQR